MVKCPKCKSTNLNPVDYRFTKDAIFSTVQIICKNCKCIFWHQPLNKVKIKKISEIIQNEISSILNSKCEKCNHKNFKIKMIRLTKKGKVTFYIKCRCGNMIKKEYTLNNCDKLYTFLYHALNGTIKNKNANKNKDINLLNIKKIEFYKILKTYLDGVQIKFLKPTNDILESINTYKEFVRNEKKLKLLIDILNMLPKDVVEFETRENESDNSLYISLSKSELKIIFYFPKEILSIASCTLSKKDPITLIKEMNRVNNFFKNYQKIILSKLTENIYVKNNLFDLLNSFLKLKSD